MGDIALRGNKLTKGQGGHGPIPYLNKPGQAQGTHGGKAKGGRIGLKHGTKPWGTGPKPGTAAFVEHHLHKPRKGKALGSIVKAAVKRIKKHIDTKKGKFPETESLTHQVGPYVGDVGSEGKRLGPKAGRRSWGDREAGPTRPQGRRIGRKGRGKDFSTRGKDIPTMAAEGGRIGFKKGTDKRWMQKVSASIKKRGTKGKCTPITKPGCTGRAKALAKTFKKIAAKRKA